MKKLVVQNDYLHNSRITFIPDNLPIGDLTYEKYMSIVEDITQQVIKHNLTTRQAQAVFDVCKEYVLDFRFN